MKDLLKFKNTLCCGVRHCGRVLSLIAVLTAFSASAVATDYYFWGYATNSPQKDGTPAVKAVKMTANGSSFTYNVSGYSSQDYCFFITTSNSTTLSTAYSSMVVAQNVTSQGSGEYYLLRGGYGNFDDGNYIYHFYSSSNDAVVVTYNSSNNSLTVTSGSGPTPTGNAPEVFWAAYPSMGMNTVSLYGHLHTRDCNTITEAGFYWSTSHIDEDDAKDVIEAGEDTHIIAATSPSPIETLAAGDDFSAENVDINMQESRVIYLVNYAKTAEGGIGISDEVALSYDYCDPMENGDVTLNQTEVKLPVGAKFEFEAIAHNAGKNPIFEWKDGATVIADATADTLVYEMPDENPHTITVTVTGRCGDTDKVSASAEVTTCEAPTITIDSEALTSTTPWVSVTVTFTTENVTTAEWSVTPETAELSGLTNNVGTYSGTFRAPASEMDSTPYTIEIRAKNSTCAGSVEAVKSHTINVTKDLDTCDNE